MSVSFWYKNIIVVVVENILRKGAPMKQNVWKKTLSDSSVSERTSFFNSIQTDLNKLRHRGSFTLAERRQMAAEDSIWDETT